MMEHFVSLKKNSDFGKVYRQGRSFANRVLVMYVLPGSRDHIGRIGISVSKKVGNSVVRHRIKRLIRENIRLNLTMYDSSSDYVIIARKGADGASFHEIGEALMKLIRRHKGSDHGS